MCERDACACAVRNDDDGKESGWIVLQRDAVCMTRAPASQQQHGKVEASSRLVVVVQLAATHLVRVWRDMLASLA